MNPIQIGSPSTLESAAMLAALGTCGFISSSAAVAFSCAWMALTMLYWSSQVMVLPGGQRSRTVPNQFSIGEGLDVGTDLGSAVDFTYKLPFTFTGEIEKVTFDLK